MRATYNLWLVGLSVAVAMGAAYAAISQARGICRSPAGMAREWRLLGAAVAMGSGVWTMHFTGMMAFRLPIPLSYDLGLTAASFGLAFLGAGGAFSLARQASEGRRHLLPSALLMTAGIVAMHYTGLYAMRMEPPITYDPVLFSTSIAISLVAAYAALWLAFHAPGSFDSPGWMLGSAVLMGAAISGMHYVSMAGAHFDEQARSLADPLRFAQDDLALIAGSGSFLIICVSVLFSIASPLFSLWRLVALILGGEFAVMVLLDYTLRRGEGFDWLRDIVDGLLLALKEHRKCDDPRVAGGPDVLSKSAAPSQAETKHKGTEPA